MHMRQGAGNVISKAELMVRKGFLSLVFLLSSVLGFSQNDIPVGTWRTHNSYNSLRAITSNSNVIFAATNNAYFEYDVATGELSTVTSLTGLNDSDITAISHTQNVDKLIIAYRNGNIDIVDDSKIISFKDLLNADLSGSKQVNHIFHYQNDSYLSTDFGVMIIDLDNLLVKDTYFELGPNGEKIAVFASCIESDSLYIATEAGLLRGSLVDNLKDFNQWQQYTISDGLPVAETRVILPTPDGLLAAVNNEGLFQYDGSSWQDLNLLSEESFINGSQDGSLSLITTDSLQYTFQEGLLNSISSENLKKPVAAIRINGEIYIADEVNGLFLQDQDQSVYPNGPFSGEVSKLFYTNETIYAFPSAFNSFYQPARNPSGFFAFSNGEWENYNDTGLPNTQLIPEFYDITGAAYSSSNNALYLSSMGYGIMKISDGNYDVFNEDNSTLNNLIPPGPNTYVSAICEADNTIAAVNYSSFEALHQYEVSSNTWNSLSPGLPAPYATQILSDGTNYWLKISSIGGGTIMVIDHEGANNRILSNDISSGNLPDNIVNDIILDLEGKMWVATEKGVVYYPFAQFILEEDTPDPIYPYYENNILFKNENITALAVDGGNRIWMGASSGLWLFDDDGRTEVSYFNTDNSPLPSNNIFDIEVNQSSGEVFVATDKGLVSYRGTSTLAGKKDEIKIFPNPVLVSQHNTVTIEGLAANSDVWITDASGKLVFKTQANGNTAVWQGLSVMSDLSSGIYYVFAADSEGNNQQIGKIAIVE